jgi:hypothetical protein
MNLDTGLHGSVFTIFVERGVVVAIILRSSRDNINMKITFVWKL